MNLLPSCCRCAVPCLLAVAACSASSSVGSTANQGQSSSPEITHEPCDVQSKSAVKIDVNNDRRADIIKVMDGSRETCRAVDLNFDHKVDSFLYFDQTGKLRRRESDFDRDGLIDEIAHYQAGRVQRKERETNLDGKLDTWDTFLGEKISKRERDTNADGKVDQWWTFPTAGKVDCPVVVTDDDGDGRPDSQHDICKEQGSEPAAQHQPAPPTSATPGAAPPTSAKPGAAPPTSAKPDAAPPTSAKPDAAPPTSAKPDAAPPKGDGAARSQPRQKAAANQDGGAR